MHGARRLPFTQLDVFTNKRFSGNALAVVHDANGLSTEDCQAIARETNLAETTFVFPRDPAIEKEGGIRVRIFTVQEELPFAGHPTLGTAFYLRGDNGATEIRLELNVGTVPVQFQSADGEPLFGEMTQVEPAFGQIHDSRTV